MCIAYNTIAHLPLEMDGLKVAVAAAKIRDIVVAVVCIATEDDVVGTATDGTVHNQQHTALIHITIDM